VNAADALPSKPTEAGIDGFLGMPPGVFANIPGLR
jgi:hypothetical protein